MQLKASRWRPTGRASSLLLLVVVPVLAMLFASNAAASWSIQETPSPGSSENEFAGVWCPATTSCQAVGRNSAASGFGAFWNGTSWAQAGMFGTPPKWFEDVSCVSASSCEAVAQTVNSAGEEFPTFHQLSGNTWYPYENKLFMGFMKAVVHGVSCSSTTSCFAVGRWSEGALSVRFNGATWEAVSAANPAGTEPELTDVSCLSATSCIAVGQYQSGGTVLTLTEIWNGTEWRVVSSPNVSGATVSTLQGVSCTSATACTAVGRSVSSGLTRPLVERWNGTSWTVQGAPFSGEGTELSDVACPSSTSCIAVGSYKSGTSQFPTALSWNGSSWTVQTVANPTPPAGSILKANLNGVSCNTSTVCTAVGWYRFVTNGVPGEMYTLAERGV